ncbi:MAG TPA: class III extradiol ring-cleavage dioxygenase, partial [Vicinamibacterales bacterium]
MNTSDSQEQRVLNPKSMRAPALFVGFPSPDAASDADYVQALRRLGVQLRKPRGIVVATARWHTVRPLRVTGHPEPPLLPHPDDHRPWASRTQARCVGQPGLAARAADLLGGAGLPAVVDASRGLDAASWMPVSLVFGRSEVPTIEVSLPAGGSPGDMMAVGAALAPLRSEGVLLVGSGAVVCNPHRARPDRGDGLPESWARAFDDWVSACLETLDVEALADYRRRGPHAHISAPTPEFLDPLLFVLGARMPGDRIVTLFEGFHAGSLSLRTCLLVGRRKTDLR